MRHWLRAANTRNSVSSALIAAVIIVGTWDQTTAAFVPDYPAISAKFSQDDRFVKRIEGIMPAGSMIYQFPYRRFPENGETDYDEARGYLHSTTLRWSYGAMAGTKADDYVKGVINRADLPATLRNIRTAGYTGLWLHGAFYDDPSAFQTAVTYFGSVLGRRPIMSDDGSLAFFDLR